MLLQAPVGLPRSAHVIVLGNEKGGSGKSTTAMHVAVALMKAGQRVATIDLDSRQRSFTHYVENRRAWAQRVGVALELPTHFHVGRGEGPSVQENEAAEFAGFAHAVTSAEHCHDFVVIDTPATDSYLMRLAHSMADTLVTPLNDSFIDFDLLGDIDPDHAEIVRPSIYSEMVWESRKRKAQNARAPIDWVVLRNRTSASRIEAKNKQKVGQALKTLSTRIGFRMAPGLSERVIYRELFPQGLTLLDLDTQSGAEGEMRMSHLAARQELRDLFLTLKLPGLEGETLRF
jgi:chromosome partitioning protein